MQENKFNNFNYNTVVDDNLADEFVSEALSQVELTCPKCSQRISDLSETYFVGCPMCYKVFAREVEKLANSYHGTCQHFGKAPKKDLKAKIESELARLREEENKAVVERDYIKAEEIKRKINALRGGE